MAKDFPDFHSPIMAWPQRDWATVEIRDKWIMSWSVFKIGPGGMLVYTTPPIPAGTRLLISDIYCGAGFRGDFFIHSTIKGRVFSAFYDEWTTFFNNLTTPYSFPEGDEIELKAIHQDISREYVRFGITGYEIFASGPERKENDSPIEKYKKWDFNLLNFLPISEEESIVIFSNEKEEKINYLRFKNYGKPDQKILASIKSKPEHIQEILLRIQSEPKKIKKILEDFENNYK